MKRLFAVIATLLLIANAGIIEVHAAALKPQVRTQLSANQAHAGERVMLDIAVLVPGWFTAPLDLPASVELDGATVRLADSAASNISERIDGQIWAGIQRRYEIVPGRAGMFVIPPVSVEFRWSNGTLSEQGRLQSTPQNLSVRLPPELEALGYFIASPQYQIEQQFDRPLSKLRVGDAITRTINQRAVGLRAMQLPALLPAPLQGIATYPEVAQLADHLGQRGAADTATRRDRMTYVLQQEGQFELPALAVRWYDTSSKAIRTTQLSAIRFTVTASAEAKNPVATPPAPATAIPPHLTLRQRVRSLHDKVTLAGTLLFVAVTLSVIALGANRRRWYPWCRVTANRIRSYLDPHERRVYRRCLRKMKGAAPSERLAALEAWHASLPSCSSAGLQEMVAENGSQTLALNLARLQRQVYGAPSRPSTSLSEDQAITLLKQLRNTWLATERQRQSGNNGKIPMPTLTHLPNLQP